ncbi:hypothetical protein EOA64_26440 [Mesorhizobium sp. M1A.F.Ca.IN.022.02.1.1]|uniref:hypothetical protein n=1 Tax=Mesorhizobium sp. M1A.F.Ca.IN.022.02.1.1 TaxID=2496766 RepID=UPI000FCB2663|nr:hypothetical protein [Mesorhizobium sp. M1A.F.Ca.IN.022.02.1.1]RUV57356.1 hypothetical protein EOA64_26440 [Mesorhizobium sp. M1A.F.Ca.IN.022.02.1.1]
MRIAYFDNAKLEAEVLDGNLLALRNLSSDGKLNLAGNDPLKGGRLAIVFDDYDGNAPLTATISFDSPGDISRNAIDLTKK